MEVMRPRIFRMIPVAAMVVLALSGCGAGDSKPKASQVAVKVNNSEISVHQLNAVLSKIPGVTQENVAQVRQDVLSKLIDQQLAYDQGVEKKLDRNPDVMMAIEAAKREIVARAYFDQLLSGVAKPSEDEARRYYAENPALFSQRKVYNLQEITLAKTPESRSAASQEVAAGKSMEKIAEALKAQNIPFGASAGAKAAEQLPLDLVPKLANQAVGQITFIEGAQNNFIIRIEAAQLAPVDEATALPRILVFLQNSAAQKMVEGEISRLKQVAKIEYVGEFAKGAAAVPAAAEPKPKAVAAENKAMDANMEKGVKGLK